MVAITSPSVSALSAQLERQRLVLEYLQAAFEIRRDRVPHVLLVPKGLATGDIAPILTWETLARAYRGIAPAHWRDVLDRALNSYESLKSIKATQGRNAAAIMTGSEIVAHHADGRARQLADTGLQLAAHVTAGHATATAELAQYSYRAP